MGLVLNSPFVHSPTRRPTKLHAFLAAAGFCLPTAVSAAAQAIVPNEPVAAFKDGKVLHAYRIGTNPPRVDGVLDDEVWERAPSVGDFIQRDPDNMAASSEATFFQIAYDERYLYVAIRCDDRTPDAIASGLGRRDELPPTDNIGVGFDPRHDHLTGYVFVTNPAEVQFDFFFSDDDRVDRDFDAVWEVRTSTDREGWKAEYRIPFSQMRFSAPPGPQSVWGIGIRRSIHRRGETSEWTGRPRGERGEVSRWGHLVFDEPLSPPRRIEVLPYVLSRNEWPAGKAAAIGGASGADARVGIGSSSTLSATINPDFGQVEQDPAVLNLSVFETFFPEKRPFFLEDSRTFVPPQQLFQLFHSRRIGRVPDRYSIASIDTVVERPDSTTILGAAKFTGKASGWTYGALTAVTGREHATVNLGEKRLVEPTTSHSVIRLQRDIHRSSNIGLLATTTAREQDEDAQTGGVDFNIRWDRNRGTLDGTWAVTHAPGTGGVRTGFGGVTNFGVSRKHVSFSSSFDHLDRNFRVNDLGFLRERANRTRVGGLFTVEQPDPWKGFRRIGTTVSLDRAWNDEHLVFREFIAHGVSMQFRNFWTFDVLTRHDFETLDDLDTRGGPPIVHNAGSNINMEFGSDSRKTWRVGGGAGAGRDASGGYGAGAGTGISLQPSARLLVNLRLNYNMSRRAPQWIQNSDVTGDGVVDNVYGSLDRNVIDITVRSTYAINRDLTLQAFLQPFVAEGHYNDIRRLALPRSFEFEPVTLSSNPDFNRKSLRGNVVLRWEYVRGSTLYCVWNLSTSDMTRAGVFSPFRDLGGAFGAEGTHIFMVKASYWLIR